MRTIFESADPLINEAEAAQALGVKPGPRKVWRTTKRYRLEYIKVGRSVRYRGSAIDAFLRSRTIAA